MNKINECVQVNLRVTTNSNQGGRKYMEDAYAIALQRLDPSDKQSPISLAYFGVFDGHGGKEAAEYARQSLCQHILDQDDFWPNNSDENQNDELILSAIRQGFLACHKDMWNHVDKWAKTSSGLPSTSGCTATVVFIRGNKLYVGHVGDSAIVLGEGETLYKSWLANRVTRDHKPEDPLELKRILESGGNVLCKAGVHRVVWNRQKVTTNSTNQYRHRHQHSVTTTTTTTTSTGTAVEYEQIPFLAVSRALGDLWSLNAHSNLYSVSPEPELSVIEIDSNKHRCIILASDGLWNMITPEVAVEIVRNCDIKTEEMILKSDDDDHRPFRNPSHELVQKALTLWRQRMLRADNITCVTVMLDPPGPPFSDCVVQKKKERLTYSMSSSTNSVCSDDTIELDQLSPMTPTTMKMATSQKRKPILERKEQILTPISNGPTPIRNQKRPAPDDVSTLVVDNPRRKLIKTNQQKENGRVSASINEIPSERDMTSSLPSTSFVEPSSLRSNNDVDQEQELSNHNEQTTNSSIFDDNNYSNDDKHDIIRKIEQELDDRFVLTSQSSEDLSKGNSSRLNRTRSISTTLPINNEMKLKLSSSRRRKSFSSTDFTTNSNNMRANKSTSNDTNYSVHHFKKRSTSSKTKSSLLDFVMPTSKQSLITRFKKAFTSSHTDSPSSGNLIHSIVSSSSSPSQ